MCGRVVIALDEEHIRTIVKASRMRSNNLKYIQSYNVTPGKYIPAAFNNYPTSTTTNNKEYSLEAMKWGTKNKDNISVVNARSENVALFFKHWRRCVIVISGYYEWKKITAKSDSEEVLSTQPYYIHAKDKNHLVLAGVYKNEEEKEVLIITMNANESINHIHHRMPVILNDSLIKEYLDQDQIISYEDLVIKSVGKDNIQLCSYPVGDLVTKLSNNGPENIIHKDDIKYDKNKNLKLTNFFKKNITIELNEENKINTEKEEEEVNSLAFENESNEKENESKLIPGDKSFNLKTHSHSANTNTNTNTNINVNSDMKESCINDLEFKSSTYQTENKKVSKKRKSEALIDPILSISKKKITYTSTSTSTASKYNTNLLKDFFKIKK